jgi:hypothetical protein
MSATAMQRFARVLPDSLQQGILFVLACGLALFGIACLVMGVVWIIRHLVDRSRAEVG